MGLNIGLSFFIHLLIVLTVFILDFIKEVWHAPALRYGIVLFAIVLEVFYFIALSFLR